MPKSKRRHHRKRAHKSQKDQIAFFGSPQSAMKFMFKDGLFAPIDPEMTAQAVMKGVMKEYYKGVDKSNVQDIQSAQAFVDQVGNNPYGAMQVLDQSSGSQSFKGLLGV